MVMRGDMDVSSMVQVTPEMPGVVAFSPITRALTGLRVGRVPVAFSLGDKIRRTEIEVQPPVEVAAGDGNVMIEPAATTLAVGQCESLRVFIVTNNGDRVDRTSTAVFKMTNPATAKMMGERVCATAPGSADILAIVGALKPGRASVNVTGDPITDVTVDPKQIDLSVGDSAQISIFGRAASGFKELFPQADLHVSTARQGIIALAGVDGVRGLAIGQDTINVNWKSLPPQQIQVNVANNPYTDLRIEPSQQAISVGATVPYQITAMRGGQRQVLQPENGVQLFPSDPNVGQVMGGLLAVMGRAPGRTAVIAQLGNQRAEAALEVLSAGAGGPVP